ncbi:hypothetical protein VKT23_013998 [Stygiomarasmius scandens]|uniref:Uncharacterized protein n=1 Tax=Marasmiellus scandens TaxID=2682957 RepID=A0ABR1J2Z0_9AGAR
MSIYGDPYLCLVPKEDQEWLNDEYVEYLDKLWNFNKAFVKNSIRQMMQEGQSIPAVVLQQHAAFIAQEETVSDGDTLMEDIEYISRVNTPLDYTDDEEAEDLNSNKENIPPPCHSPSPDSIPKWTPETGNHNWETNKPGSGWEEADWNSDGEELPLLPLPHKERGYGAGENQEFFLRTLGSQLDDDDTRHWCITREIEKDPKQTQVYVTKWIDGVRYRTTTPFEPYLWKPLHYSEVWQMQKGKETWEEYKSTWSKEWQDGISKQQKEFLDSEQGMELLSRIRKEFDGNFADEPTYKPNWVLEIPEQKIPAEKEVIQQEQLVNPEDQMNPPSKRFSHNNWGPMTVQNAQAFYDDLYHNKFKFPLPTPPPSPSTGSEEKLVFNTDSKSSQTSSHSPTLADYGDEILCQQLKEAQKDRMEWEAQEWGVDAPLYKAATHTETFDELNQQQFGHNKFVGIDLKAFTSQDNDEKKYNDDDTGFEDFDIVEHPENIELCTEY